MILLPLMSVVALIFGLYLVYLVQQKVIGLNEESERYREKLRALEGVIDAVPAIICWIGRQGHYLGVNNYLANSLWLDQGDFAGKTIDFRPELANLAEFVRQFISSPKATDSKVIPLPFQGRQQFYLIAVQKYQQSEEVVAVGIDITELISTQKVLEEKETLLQLVLDNIPELIFWKDCNSVFRGCNRIWAETACIRENDDIIGKTDYDLYRDHQRAELYRSQDRRVIETGKPEFFSEYKADKDKWFDTKKIPIRNANGDIIGILSTVQDITPQKKVEEALRIAEENYRSIFENALEGIFQSSPEGKYLSVNRAMAEIYGYDSPQEMIALVDNIERIYVSPQGRKQFKHILTTLGKVKNWEYQVYRRDGQIIWIEENTRGVYNDRGELLYYEGIVNDITERKLKEQDLEKQIEELRIHIDRRKKELEVAKITQSDYFQELKAEFAKVELDSFWNS